MIESKGLLSLELSTFYGEIDVLTKVVGITFYVAMKRKDS